MHYRKKFTLTIGKSYTVIRGTQIKSMEAMFLQSTKNGFNLLCAKTLRNVYHGYQYMYPVVKGNYKLGDTVKVWANPDYVFVPIDAQDHDIRVSEATRSLLEEDEMDVLNHNIDEYNKSIDILMKERDEYEEKLNKIKEERQKRKCEIVNKEIDEFARCLKGIGYAAELTTRNELTHQFLHKARDLNLIMPISVKKNLCLHLAMELCTLWNSMEEDTNPDVK